jgi:hypothetical protein
MNLRLEDTRALTTPRGGRATVFRFLLAIGCSITVTGCSGIPSACARCCGCDKPLSNHGRCRPAPLLYRYAVETPRCARPSICHPMDDGIAFRRQLVQQSVRYGDALTVFDRSPAGPPYRHAAAALQITSAFFLWLSISPTVLPRRLLRGACAAPRHPRRRDAPLSLVPRL